MPRFDLDLCELENYRPEIREPKDFDEFWRRTLDENVFDSSEICFQKIETSLKTVEVWDIQFPGFGGHPIRAWYVFPAGTQKRLPTIIQFQGYGGGRGLPVEHLEWASVGFAHFFMDTRGQGGTWGSGGVTSDPVGSSSADQGFMTRGIQNQDDYYYRRLYVDAHHAVEAAVNLPWTDSTQLIADGISQGGGLAIAAAVLNQRTKLALIDVPFLNHFERAVGLSEGTPYDEVVRYLSVRRDCVDRVFKTLSYFDGANFAKRAKIPALFSTALLDTVCPPSLVFATKNWWNNAASADIEVYNFNGHEGGQWHHWQKQIAWLDAHGVRA